MTLRCFVISFFLVVLPTNALAWGQKGHRIVGQLAEQRLTPAAAMEVKRLLASEADPTLAGVSVWADDLRANDPERARLTGRWHYINFSNDTCDYQPARDCPDGKCVIAAINRNFLILADRKRSDNERTGALKFLVHFIGDVHQPLHASAGNDRGGNDFQVNFKGKNTNLHSVWDGLIFEQSHQDIDNYTKTLNMANPLPPDTTRRSDRPAVEWALESCRYSSALDFYPSTHSIDDRYLLDHRALAELRLRQAGTRLADMINYALAKPMNGK